MDICYCEIARRWPGSANARMDILQECEKRGLLKSTLVEQHGHYERVWKPVVWTEVRR